MTGFAACHAGEARILTASERLVAAAATRRAADELAEVVAAYLDRPTTSRRDELASALTVYQAVE